MPSKPVKVSDLIFFYGDRSRVTAVDQSESNPSIGRDAYRLGGSEGTVGYGSIVVGLVWLALYVIVVLFGPTSEQGASTSTAKTPPATVTSSR